MILKDKKTSSGRLKKSFPFKNKNYNKKTLRMNTDMALPYTFRNGYTCVFVFSLLATRIGEPELTKGPYLVNIVPVCILKQFCTVAF